MAGKKNHNDNAGFIAYADFEFKGKTYKNGDVFDASGLRRDADFETFRDVEKRRTGGSTGAVFYEETPPIVKDGDPIVHRHILPVTEA